MHLSLQMTTGALVGGGVGVEGPLGEAVPSRADARPSGFRIRVEVDERIDPEETDRAFRPYGSDANSNGRDAKRQRRRALFRHGVAGHLAALRLYRLESTGLDETLDPRGLVFTRDPEIQSKESILCFVAAKHQMYP
ncbi:hypothetical protein EYF80_043994 [Liparis tanakae]|uniref:Uncharacterized protein n=1 Tax=Liparis tanakae TaxID=230148 RepID=A0A4Z2FX09_9TELE|nr:hypothetical protein EYF80_043994 [Liparis tanakae]